MNNLPRQTLRRIIGKHGREICGDARRCASLLNDWCGSYRREINVLVNAVEEGVPLDLLAAGRSTPLEVLLKRLKKRLEEHTAMTAEAASWAVDSWALALSVATDAEIEKAERRARSSTSDAEALRPKDSTDRDEILISGQTHRSQPPPTPSPTLPPAPPPLPQKANPPIVRPQAQTRTPVPSAFPPANQPPNVQTTSLPGVDKRRFGFFRGCLFVMILLIFSSIVLFLGVPYALEVMRETQRERNNEPPRFPVR